MAHKHGLDSHQETISSYRRLKFTLVIVLTVMVAEVIGGIFSGSLALLGDDGHMLVDALALGLSLFAMAVARRPASATKTFGYNRVEILTALEQEQVLANYRRCFELQARQTARIITGQQQVYHPFLVK